MPRIHALSLSLTGDHHLFKKTKVEIDCPIKYVDQGFNTDSEQIVLAKKICLMRQALFDGLLNTAKQEFGVWRRIEETI